MKLPHSLNPNNNPIIPFCTNNNEIVVKKVIQNFPKKNIWLENGIKKEKGKVVSERKTRKLKVLKLDIKPSKWEDSKNFFQAKKRIEGEIRSLFIFLQNTDILKRINLIDKLNIKITAGEITTVDQIESFFDKVKELADCIKLYLLKNEYNENFMQEITMDVFEKGFTVKQEDIRKTS